MATATPSVPIHSGSRAHGAASPSSPSGFDAFDLEPRIARGVRAAGYAEPRPIQLQTIPAALDGSDVLGLAQTGTGKTAAFAIPILDALVDERPGRPLALVLAPTRELAAQIDGEFRTLAKFTKLRTATVFGGVAPSVQIRALRDGPQVVVGCPGRVLDLVQRGALHLDEVEILVLDEADHMFDMGFLPDVRRILAALPRERQNLLFSATMPKDVRKLADEVLHRPHVVELASASPASTIEHALYPVAEDRKRALLDRMLDADGCESVIVFTRTKHRARRLAQQLEAGGRRAVALQGNMSQSQRERAMRGFRGGQFDVLVATDIAARGIDVTGVSHVINFDVPTTPEAYLHRIGRTGRAEREGTAATFVTREDAAWVRATERLIGAPIARGAVEGFELEAAMPEREPHRGGGGRGGARPGAGGARRAGGAPGRSGGRRRRPRSR
ncbi:MAG: DEAD/DEAH box helicase [Myxococcota bacterium]